MKYSQKIAIFIDSGANPGIRKTSRLEMKTVLKYGFTDDGFKSESGWN